MAGCVLRRETTQAFVVLLQSYTNKERPSVVKGYHSAQSKVSRYSYNYKWYNEGSKTETREGTDDEDISSNMDKDQIPWYVKGVSYCRGRKSV